MVEEDEEHLCVGGPSKLVRAVPWLLPQLWRNSVVTRFDMVESLSPIRLVCDMQTQAKFGTVEDWWKILPAQDPPTDSDARLREIVAAGCNQPGWLVSCTYGQVSLFASRCTRQREPPPSDSGTFHLFHTEELTLAALCPRW